MVLTGLKMNNLPDNWSFDLVCIFFQNSFNCFISQKLILFLCFIFTDSLGSNEIRIITWYEVLSNYWLRLVISYYGYVHRKLPVFKFEPSLHQYMHRLLHDKAKLPFLHFYEIVSQSLLQFCRHVCCGTLFIFTNNIFHNRGLSKFKNKIAERSAHPPRVLGQYYWLTLIILNSD